MNYADFWRRFAAALIDAIILQIGFSIIASIIFGTEFNTPEGATTNFIPVMILSTLLYWLYYSLMESSSKQATLGKMALGIFVTDLNGNKISFGKATVRYFSKIISGLILGIGFLMAAFTEKRQALHDMIAGCLVLRKRYKTQLASTKPAFREGDRSFSISLSSGRTIYLTEGMKLRETDIPELQSNSFDGVVVEVNRNPNDPKILGLKNLSRQSWAVSIAGGERRQIDSGQSIKLAIGTKINFGYVEGEIHQ